MADDCDTLEKLEADERAYALERKPPDLQALVAHWGGYDKIPPEASADFSARRDAWRQRLRAGEFFRMEFELRARRRALMGVPEPETEEAAKKAAEKAAEKRQAYEARDASFVVYRDPDGVLRRESIEDALKRLETKADT